jgi:hypothetical protein
MSFEETIRETIRSEFERALRPLSERLDKMESRLGAANDAQFLSAPKAAALAGYKTTDVIHEWIRDGLLRPYGHGRIRVKRSELMSVLEGRKKKPVTVVDMKTETDRIARKLLAK